MKVSLETAAVDAVKLQLDARIDLHVNASVHAAATWLTQNYGEAIRELVPSYCSLLIYYDVLEFDEIRFRRLVEQPLKRFIENFSETSSDKQQPGQKAPTTHTIEVCYHPDVALDIESVAKTCGCSVTEVAERHQGVTYQVYTLGFAPGFAYLGDVPESLRVPRHDSPRQKVPKGSVAIAQQQTAIYPQQSPGGWQVIGRAADWPVLTAGDRVKFVAIDLATYQQRVQHDEGDHD